MGTMTRNRLSYTDWWQIYGIVSKLTDKKIPENLSFFRCVWLNYLFLYKRKQNFCSNPVYLFAEQSWELPLITIGYMVTLKLNFKSLDSAAVKLFQDWKLVQIFIITNKEVYPIR